MRVSGVPATSDPVTFQYRFEFDDGSAREFEIRLNPGTLELIDRPTGTPPAWTRLDNHRCENCPLDRLDAAASSERGLLIRRAQDLMGAMRLGLTVTPADIAADEFYAALIMADEREKLNP